MTATTTDPDPTTGSVPSTDATAAAHAYVAEVRQHLRGLDEEERDDLLDDLIAHVHEVAAHDSRPLDEALGRPATFAVELLASAGLADRPRGLRSIAARASAGTAVAGDRVRALGESLSPALGRVRRHPWATATTDFLPQLRPAWWLARGWLLVVGFWLLGAESWGRYALPEILGSTLLGVAAGVGCAVASVHIARRRPGSRWRHVVNALAIVAAVALLLRGDDLARTQPADIVGMTFPDGSAQVRHPDGSAITNIHAYDAAGEPIERVRLYDQDGRPIEVLDTPDPYATPRARDEVLGTDGLPVRNVYPVDQFALEWDPATHAEVRRSIPEPLLSVAPLPAPATAAHDEGQTGTAPSAPAGTDPAGSDVAPTVPGGEPVPGS